MTRTLVFVAAVAVAIPALAQEEAEVIDTGVPPQVMAVYEQGKAAYDAKQYALALEKFDRCVDMDPSRARWHYNRGLALKKLHRDEEARQAFADSRRMDPEYKAAEIDKKLAELGGGSPASSSSSSGGVSYSGSQDLTPLCMGCFCVGFIAVGLWSVLRSRRPAQQSAEPAQHHDTGPRLIRLLEGLAARQSRLELALAAVEDAELVSAATRAGDELQFARFSLDRRDFGPAEQALGRASTAVDAAERRLHDVKGVGWTPPRPEKSIGCFFCARPLASAAARRGVTLSQSSASRQVVACRRCAEKAAAGAPLEVVCAGEPPQHWSQVQGFDPYQHGYWGGPPVRDVPVWRLDLLGERWSALEPLVGLSIVGAGAALLGSIDLDAARAAEAAAAATAAAAAHAQQSRRNDSSGWRDHS